MDAPAFEAATPVFSVVDLERALGWYERVLGFERAWSWGDPPTLASVCRGRVELNLGRRGAAGPSGPGRVYLRVSPVDALWEQVVASGAEVTAPLEDRAYGMREFSVRDESGNVIDFGEPTQRASGEAAAAAPAADVMKVFVPAKDFALSKRFYEALGFARNWESDGLAEIELGGTKLLLQDFHVKEWAENFMIHVEVHDADAWARCAQQAIASGAFPGVRIQGPCNEPWGYRVTYVIDPSGVLLRFSQPLARPAGG